MSGKNSHVYIQYDINVLCGPIIYEMYICVSEKKKPRVAMF